MLTVKQVATKLGIDERSVRDKLMAGTLKGTKKTIGQKEQWFVHQRDLDAEMARRGLSPINQEAASQETQQQYVPPQAAPWPSQFSQRTPVSQGATSQEMYQQYAQPQAAPWPPQGGQQTFNASDLQVLPPEMPLPTMKEQGPEEITVEVSQPHQETQSSRMEGERLGWRNEDLEKQVLATAETFMKPLIEKVQELTREGIEKDRLIEEQKKQLLLLPDLESQKAKLLRDIEAERKASEIQHAKVAEKEEEARALEAENERLRLKAEEAVLSAQKLEELEKVVQELQKPKPSWWRKLWMPSAGHENES